MNIKKKVIGFIPGYEFKDTEHLIDYPIPSRLSIPDWYKKLPLYRGKNKFDGANGANSTVKGCIPFLESLTLGYSLVVQQDLEVTRSSNGAIINWGGGIPIVKMREGHEYMPVPVGCDFEQFSWNTVVGFELPKGYSAIITHPLNRYDLPFISSSGVYDDGLNFNGTFSFWLKKDFEGIIPAGTPYAQIIPFKREPWKSEKRTDLIVDAEKIRVASLKRIGGYKKLIQKKKTFE
jgi:hypothetical protein